MSNPSCTVEQSQQSQRRILADGEYKNRDTLSGMYRLSPEPLTQQAIFLTHNTEKLLSKN